MQEELEMDRALCEEMTMAAPVGEPWRWSRDMTIVGAVTAFCGPVWFVSLFGWGFVAAATITGAALGAALGSSLSRLLAGPLRRVPMAGLLLLVPMLGFAWGGLTGGLASLFLDPVGIGIGLTFLSVCVAGVAGALQLGWFWMPYTLAQIRGRATQWPVLAACTAAPLLGPAGALTVLAAADWLMAMPA